MYALYVELNLLTANILYSNSYIGNDLSSTGNTMLLLIIVLIIIKYVYDKVVILVYVYKYFEFHIFVLQNINNMSSFRFIFLGLVIIDPKTYLSRDDITTGG